MADVERLRALLDLVSLPWRGSAAAPGSLYEIEDDDDAWVAGDVLPDEAELIVEAVNALPDLLDELDDARVPCRRCGVVEAEAKGWAGEVARISEERERAKRLAVEAADLEARAARAESQVIRILTVVAAAQDEQPVTGEPAESVQIGRWQLCDEIHGALSDAADAPIDRLTAAVYGANPRPAAAPKLASALVDLLEHCDDTCEGTEYRAAVTAARAALSASGWPTGEE